MAKKKIESASEAAAAIARLTPAKRQLLINAMRTQLPNMRGATAEEVEQFLTEYVANNKIPL